MITKDGIAETPRDRQAQLWPLFEWLLREARPRYEWVPLPLWKALEKLAKHFLLLFVTQYRRINEYYGKLLEALPEMNRQIRSNTAIVSALEERVSVLESALLESVLENADSREPEDG